MIIIYRYINMENIYKIIYKYKNNNGYNQYNIFIFLNEVDNEINKILDKIKNYSLQDIFIKLNKQDNEIMINKYGNKWFIYFYNYYHIKKTLKDIKNSDINNYIIKNLKELYTIYFDNLIIDKKIIRGYNELKNYELKINKISKNKNILKGGNKKEENDNEKEQEIEYEDINLEIENTNIIDEELYNENKNILKETSKEIQKLINTNKQENIKFDLSNNKLQYDDKLENIFNKEYIFNNIIYSDDTINKIKKKICLSINLNEINSNYILLPSRLYLWLEYNYNNNINQVMLGQKIIFNGELLEKHINPIDVNKSVDYFDSQKIKYENNDNMILDEYIEYINNNDIYVCDIYNEIKNIKDKDEKNIKNIYNNYVKVYFNNVLFEKYKKIINNEIENENINILEIIKNDMKLENELMRQIEIEKKIYLNSKYKNYFSENNITQIVYHVNVIQINKQLYTLQNKIDLYRIFENYIVDEEYPFIQYQTINKKIIFKIYDKFNEIIKIESGYKWFESAPYDINIKIKINENSFISVNIIQSGRIEVKYQWLENENATFKDLEKIINKTDDLLKKINKELIKYELKIKNDIYINYILLNQKYNNISKNDENNAKQYIEIQENKISLIKNYINMKLLIIDNYKIDFINTIQKIEFDNDKLVIDHNILSDFATLFYPYISIVIEPKKRKSKDKISDKGKYGSYIRYKRISNYENVSKIEYRIYYFLKNYEENMSKLSQEICEQFNITEKEAFKKITEIKEKHKIIKKKKILKSYDNIPKFKIPGIGIEIQGKQKGKYKIKIIGARNKKQLDNIVLFINTLLYLYIDIYLEKKRDKKDILKYLINLSNIAKRKNKVDYIVNIENKEKNIKKMTKVDKERIGFKPTEGLNQWSRICQNNGDKKRQPLQVYNNDKIEEFKKLGYKYNEKTEQYERKVNGEILIAPKIGKDLIYSCNPEINNDYKYIGFLQKSNNPNGLCMPCCFKKNPLISVNNDKKDYNLKCLKNENEEKIDYKKNDNNLSNQITKLYILNDISKIHENKYFMLPKSINLLFNDKINNKLIVKDHYFNSTNTGYYICYCPSQKDNSYLNCLEYIYNRSIDEIIDIIESKLKNNPNYFIYLNSGDIKNQFETIDYYINFLRNNKKLITYNYLDDILSLPNILDENATNIYIFENQNNEYVIQCKNIENITDYYNPQTKNYYFIKKNNFYFIIVYIEKNSSIQNSKKSKIINNITINNYFYYDINNDLNLCKRIFEYYKFNCISYLTDVNYENISKILYYKLQILGKDYEPIYQIIDNSNKCKYILLKNNNLIPCKLSGSIYHLDILYEYKKYLKKIEETIKYCINITNESNKNINIIPTGYYYIKKNNNKYIITKLIINLNDDISIELNDNNEYDSKLQIVKIFNKYNIKNVIKNKDSIKNIDDIILSNNIVIDERYKNIKYEKYIKESYELFKYELSYFMLNNKEIFDIFLNQYNKIKNKKNQIDKKNDSNIIKLKEILYLITDSKLHNLFIKSNSENKLLLKNNIKINKFIKIVNNIPDLKNYEINNNRQLSINSKDSYHCLNNKLILTNEMLITYINKLLSDLLSNEILIKELLNIEEYYVQDIVDRNIFTEKKNQIIINNQNINVNNILAEIFYKYNIPIIGKRRFNIIDEDMEKLINENQLNKFGDNYYQIVYYKHSLYRAYINSLYWLKTDKNTNDILIKNLGYYSNLQNSLVYIIIGNIIKWINIKENKINLINKLNIFGYDKSTIYEYLLNLNNNNNDYYIIGLYILYKIYNIPILIYNINNIPILFINNDFLYYNDNKILINIKNNILNNNKNEIKKYINLKFNIEYYDQVPNIITCIY